jgi:hypothetical protein
MSNVQASGDSNAVITAGGDVVLDSSAPAQLPGNGASIPLPVAEASFALHQ